MTYGDGDIHLNLSLYCKKPKLTVDYISLL